MSDGCESEVQQLDRQCPACGGRQTETVELERQSSVASIGVYEILSCQDCYAGFKLEYVPSGKELTHEPEVDHDDI